MKNFILYVANGSVINHKGSIIVIMHVVVHCGYIIITITFILQANIHLKFVQWNQAKQGI